MKIIIAVLLLTPAIVSAKFEMKHDGACGVPLDIFRLYRDFATRVRSFGGPQLKPACKLFEEANRGRVTDEYAGQSCQSSKSPQSADPLEVIRKLVNQLAFIYDPDDRSYGCAFTAYPIDDKQDQWQLCCYTSTKTYE
ncbi:hypothetical protein Q1695_008127 [Nippostrongylus brasiliensis]|nr:hypothetical protein Q1695_008127 [Nippostrongylus brasiliensis]